MSAAINRGASAPLTRRQRLEAAIEAAIALLDRLDGDADLEPCGDDSEPFLRPFLLDQTRDERGFA